MKLSKKAVYPISAVVASLGLIFLSLRLLPGPPRIVVDGLIENCIESYPQDCNFLESVSLGWDSLLILTPYDSPEEVFSTHKIQMPRQIASQGISLRDDITILAFIKDTTCVGWSVVPRRLLDFRGPHEYLSRSEERFSITKDEGYWIATVTKPSNPTAKAPRPLVVAGESGLVRYTDVHIGCSRDDVLLSFLDVGRNDAFLYSQNPRPLGIDMIPGSLRFECSKNRIWFSRVNPVEGYEVSLLDLHDQQTSVVLTSENWLGKAVFKDNIGAVLTLAEGRHAIQIVSSATGPTWPLRGDIAHELLGWRGENVLYSSRTLNDEVDTIWELNPAAGFSSPLLSFSGGPCFSISYSSENDSLVYLQMEGAANYKRGVAAVKKRGVHAEERLVYTEKGSERILHCQSSERGDRIALLVNALEGGTTIPKVILIDLPSLSEKVLELPILRPSIRPHSTPTQ